ncbi:polysaccharide deacetylase family protein [Desulfovibrio mangrovi]|uniref:polysaccharide deacetylase family protein n=1 Tax=Desulfovibrio mangrovi TaxID=2976983 RepID=UPI0022451331|nr:polysaccharide deacetylase family protein [Desulfovibrio mangrovi]UZP66888.1 polysaccharide deacetylase family protein [Desulfovibrio mangrovi]
MKIIMYHYVRKPDAAFPYLRFLHIDDFRRQLDFFQRDGRILTRMELDAALRDKKPLGENDYLLTFDDGLRDHYEYVLPELQERGVTGVFLHCTDGSDKPGTLDVHMVHALLGAYGGATMLKRCQELIESAGIDLQANGFCSPVYTLQPQSEETEFKRIMNYCLDKQARRHVLERLHDLYLPEFNAEGEFYLGSGELRLMDEAGMVIGGHTVSHPLLSSLDAEEQRKEVASNVDALAQILGHPVSWFCFPYGGDISYNDETLRILRDHGVQYCLSVESRDVSAADLDVPLTLPRYDCMEFPFGKSYVAA